MADRWPVKEMQFHVANFFDASWIVVLLAGQGGGRGRQGPRFSIRWIIGIFFLTLGDDDIDKGCENSQLVSTLALWFLLL